jgi:hypothetical protein
VRPKLVVKLSLRPKLRLSLKLKLKLKRVQGVWAYDIRMYAINDYGRVIHEFDPWSNQTRAGPPSHPISL